MILLEDKNNVEAPSGAYPFGSIKDDTGINDGTPVDRTVYSDIHQFFSKLFDVSVYTSNGLPDNETNGFQLFNALTSRINILIAATNPLTVQNIDSEADFQAAFSDINTSPGISYIGNATFVMYEFNVTDNSTAKDVHSIGTGLPVGTHFHMHLKGTNTMPINLILNSPDMSTFGVNAKQIIQSQINTETTVVLSANIAVTARFLVASDNIVYLGQS